MALERYAQAIQQELAAIQSYLDVAHDYDRKLHGDSTV